MNKTIKILLSLVVLAIIIFSYYLYFQKNNKPEIINENASTTLKTEQEEIVDYHTNTLYYLKNEKDCAFFLNGYKLPSTTVAPNENAYSKCGKQEIDPSKINNKTVVIQSNERITFGDHVYYIKEKGDFIYFGIDVYSKDNYQRQEFYEFNKTKGITKKIISSDNKEINLKNKSNNPWRQWFIDSVSTTNNLIAFSLHECWGCEGGEPSKLIYDLKTYESKLIQGYITNFEFLNDNSFRYKIQTQVGPCDSLGGCYENKNGFTNDKFE
jgi:hypothetical protein